MSRWSFLVRPYRLTRRTLGRIMVQDGCQIPYRGRARPKGRRSRRAAGASAPRARPAGRAWTMTPAIRRAAETIIQEARRIERSRRWIVSARPRGRDDACTVRCRARSRGGSASRPGGQAEQGLALDRQPSRSRPRQSPRSSSAPAARRTARSRTRGRTPGRAGSPGPRAGPTAREAKSRSTCTWKGIS